MNSKIQPALIYQRLMISYYRSMKQQYGVDRMLQKVQQELDTNVPVLEGTNIQQLSKTFEISSNKSSSSQQPLRQMQALFLFWKMGYDSIWLGFTSHKKKKKNIIKILQLDWCVVKILVVYQMSFKKLEDVGSMCSLMFVSSLIFFGAGARQAAQLWQSWLSLVQLWSCAEAAGQGDHPTWQAYGRHPATTTRTAGTVTELLGWDLMVLRILSWIFGTAAHSKVFTWVVLKVKLSLPELEVWATETSWKCCFMSGEFPKTTWVYTYGILWIHIIIYIYIGYIMNHHQPSDGKKCVVAISDCLRRLQ